MPSLPKDPSQRARVNKDTIATTAIAYKRAKQPRLPATMPWCKLTREWWARWGKSGQAHDFTATDWDALLDTALVHNAVWGDGNLTLAGELRLRIAKFGATPADRIRLRITFENPEQVKKSASAPASERYAGLRVLSA